MVPLTDCVFDSVYECEVPLWQLKLGKELIVATLEVILECFLVVASFVSVV